MGNGEMWSTVISITLIIIIIAVSIVAAMTALVKAYTRSRTPATPINTNPVKTNNEQPPVKKPEQPYVVRNNGWFWVQPRALLVKEDEKMRILEETEFFLPLIVRRMLYPLTIDERAFMVKVDDPFCDHAGEDKEQWTQDAKRGMTIGSALFSYTIPPSMFLLDDRTRFLCERHKQHSKQTATFEGWMGEHEDVLRSSYKVATNFEHHHQFTIKNCFEHYRKHEKYIQHILLHTINQYPIMPSVNGLVISSLTDLKAQANDLNSHLFFISLNVAIRTLQVDVPLDWILYSEMTDSVYHMVRKADAERAHTGIPSQKKMHLTLIVDN